jgi:hypothetical protein
MVGWPHHASENISNEGEAMDPDAAMAEFWSAVNDGDFRDAQARAGDLEQWAGRGGFLPSGFGSFGDLAIVLCDGVAQARRTARIRMGV